MYSQVLLIPGMRRSIQFDKYSCAVHAVRSITEYNKYHIDPDQIYEELGTTIDGTDTPDIIRFLLNAGFNVNVNTSANLADIRSAVQKGLPVIITINNWEHWVVVYGISNDRVFIIDSHYSRIFPSVKTSAFLELWDDNWIAVISK